ncbi:restriction endonuclease [Desulfovibrio sulfodismutans]|uniref:Restriction endonuclease n=1 Tax=Desulfolutivibrio sulfodismutans TaxID=63561 RepID=A0A7K3NIG5_9BACT|nr:restriction endonuclease [Desulfolutivibrio sulfodismutans]NDY55613.1 restriction endonuclease [Desulfolutivibrio sulfodismutans]QLA11685.1 restriction endonuclease [Desulfolutivibrio sulfodismutans DSM 3696]
MDIEAKSAFYVENIRKSKISIYDNISYDDSKLWIPREELEYILNKKLYGLSIGDLPLRTRSKVIKESVCRALGYDVPSSFTKTQPRFPGQDFDTYSQKSNNLQIWNEEISPSRRYVIIQIIDNTRIGRIKVLLGEELAAYDKTGTLTTKYQARLTSVKDKSELISSVDTERINTFVNSFPYVNLGELRPVDNPSKKSFLSIRSIFDKLTSLIGTSFADLGFDQERNRGFELHKLICLSLGYKSYEDNGQFPDLKNQLLEVKLQTSPTIDLGLICPDDTSELDIKNDFGVKVRHCDVRYALFYASIRDGIVTLTNLYLSSGEKFFSRFPRFEGKIVNKKIQLPLPSNFFSS